MGRHLFPWVVSLVSQVSFNSVGRKHVEVFFSNVLAVLVLVDALGLEALLKGTADGLEGLDTNPLFPDKTFLSLLQGLVVAVVNVIERDEFGALVFCAWIRKKIKRLVSKVVA